MPPIENVPLPLENNKRYWLVSYATPANIMQHYLHKDICNMCNVDTVSNFKVDFHSSLVAVRPTFCDQLFATVVFCYSRNFLQSNLDDE